ncbi:MAG: alpha/beta hydrolase [Flavobacteriales bacterium]|nr:alpha/beta hydrolase [Flavobacteriales bacterium]
MSKLLYHEIEKISDDHQWVVFIHGAGGAIETWKFQVEAFRPHFNLMLLDLRDHGRSKNIDPEHANYDFDVVTKDILAVLDHYEINKAHFVSLSLGSVILQRLDVLRPHLIDRMVMAGGIFKATFKMHFFVHSAKFLNYLLPYRTLYNIFAYIVLPKKNHQFSRRVFQRQFKRLTRKEYLKWVGLYRHFFRALREYFHRPVDKLALVVMGEEDHVFINAAKKFDRVQKHVTLEILEECGHIVNIEQHQRFNELAIDFLKTK